MKNSFSNLLNKILYGSIHDEYSYNLHINLKNIYLHYKEDVTKPRLVITTFCKENPGDFLNKKKYLYNGFMLSNFMRVRIEKRDVRDDENCRRD